MRLDNLLALVKNKYLIAVAIFMVWMTFFDQNDFITQYDYSSQISKLEKERAFYNQNNVIINKNLEELSTDISTAEKFAREKYFMKKENEDVFVLIESDTLKIKK